MSNYEQLLERIQKASNLEKEEIERKIEAKRAKLSGLVSKEGAAQIVAAELGINFEQERIKISEVMQGMRRVNLVAKITKIFPVREFEKNGRKGKVSSMVVADESSNTRLVLWDTNHISLVEDEKIKEGDVIEIAAANVRNGELHLSSFADIKKSKETMENVATVKATAEKKIAEMQPGENIQTRAVIVQVFEPKYFEVNPETGRKFTEEDKNNGLKPKQRALLNIVLDDGTETIRSVLFGEQINKLGLEDKQIFEVEEFKKAQPALLGEEKIFQGQVRANQMFNTPELTINEIAEVDPQEILKQLEAK